MTDMEADTTQPPLPPDPPQDQPGKTAPVPEYIAAFLHAVDILIGYGRHLVDTVHRRASTPTFPAIAAGFGTANISTIMAHLNPTRFTHLKIARLFSWLQAYVFEV